MLKSMTGFGVADAAVAGGRLQVEVRSVNHRHLNLQVKLPGDLQPCEAEIRDRLRDRVTRGSVTVTARWLIPASAPGAVQVNLDRARRLIDAFRELRDALRLPGDVDLGWLIRQPDVLLLTAPADQSIDAAEVGIPVDAAVAAMIAMRTVEGAALTAELERLLASVEAALATVEGRAPQRLAAERDRLRTAVAELLDGRSLEEPRLAQEIALLADKLDVREEIVRLRAHVDACRAAIAQGAAAGRQLGFLGQEMLREVNTIGSKASDAAIAHAVIAMKGEVERFREQVENVE